MAALPGGVLNSTEFVRSVPEGKPLIPGVYQGIVTRTAVKDTNDKTGAFVEVEFDITHPQESQNRKFWDRFNVVNQSDVATRIGKEGLADLAQAAGIAELHDSEQLLGIEVMMEIIIQEGKPYQDKRTGAMKEGKDQNACRKYWPVGTDLEAAKKAYREQQAKAKEGAPATAGAAAPAAARPATVAPVAATGGQWPKKATGTATPPVAQAAAAPPPPATNQAPWKRNAK